jgi:murein DD-endopeptidase MepM/ murein hydrolase activator NlpD
MSRRALAAFFGGLLAVAVLSHPVAADTASDLAAAQQRQQVIDAVRSQLNGNLADALAAQEQLTRSLKDNEQQQQQTQQKIDDANAQIAQLDAEIARLDAEVEATQKRLDVERGQLRSLARALYVEPGSVLVMLAESRNLSDLFTRVADLSSAGTRARSLKQELDADAAKLAYDQAKQEVARDQQVKLRQQLQADLATLQKLRQQEEDSKAKLAIKISQTQAELGALNGQSAQLAQQITDLLQQQQDAIIAAAMQEVWDQYKVWESQNQVNVATSTGHSKQYRFMWPEPGSQLVQGYGPTTLWFEPPYQGFPHFHTGLDLVLPLGSQVLAADDGVVALVGSGTTGYGNYVVIAHDGGLTTLYGHLSQALVKVGDHVVQAQPVGLEGSTGNSTGPHLHFELRIADKPVDPTPYLPPGPPSAFRG